LRRRVILRVRAALNNLGLPAVQMWQQRRSYGYVSVAEIAGSAQHGCYDVNSNLS